MGESSPSEVLVVVVGAGASYDCKADPPGDGEHVMPIPDGPDSDSRPWAEVRPPLTAELVDGERFVFNQLLNRHPRAAPIVAVLREALNDKENPVPLEQALREYQARGEANPSVEGQLRDFRCYLRDVLLKCGRYMLSPSVGGVVTNYTRLVTRCIQWAYEVRGHVCFVSLNYDVMLENALESVVGDAFSTVLLPTYWQEERFSLVKPHGSAAWQVDGNGQLQLEVVPDRIKSFGYPPRLALPVMPKVDLLWPDEQRDCFRRRASEATRLLTIGWRAGDTGLVEEMRTHMGGKPIRTLGVVGNSDSQARRAVMDLLESLRNLGHAPPLVDDFGFSGWLARGRLDQVFLG